MDREAWWAMVYGCKRVGHDLAIKQQQQFPIQGRTKIVSIYWDLLWLALRNIYKYQIITLYT